MRYSKKEIRGNLSMSDAIKVLRKTNLNDLVKLEGLCFAHPWLEKDFKAVLTRDKTAAFYYSIDNKMVGYIIYEMKPKHILLMNIAVHPDYRKMKIGSKLIDNLIDKLNADSRTEIACYIDEYNLDAQLFLKKKKFLATRSIKHFFENDSSAIYFVHSMQTKKRKKNESK